MKVYEENDVIYLTKPANGHVIGDENAIEGNREVVVPAGLAVTVVLVYGDPTRPKAYEIEAYLKEENCFVLATIQATDI